MNVTNPLIPAASAGPEYPRWSETLRDGHHVIVRPLTAQDRDAEREFLEGLSLDARRFRFLGQIGCPSEKLITQLTDLDYVHRVAFAAVVREDAHERIVGVSRYATDAAGEQCEFAVTVTDEWQERGLGTLLMRHLIEVARANGIRRMYSIDSAENVRMHQLAKFLAFTSQVDPADATQMIHRLDL